MSTHVSASSSCLINGTVWSCQNQMCNKKCVIDVKCYSGYKDFEYLCIDNYMPGHVYRIIVLSACTEACAKLPHLLVVECAGLIIYG